jgi:cysteine desulfurase family protein (TIGR01976 family)
MPVTQSEPVNALDIESIRAQFPSLSRKVNGNPAVFLDGPGGTQVPQRVIDAISQYLAHDNANIGGAYVTSRNSDKIVAEARTAMADFFHCDADEVIFGQNMTALTFMLSRSIARELAPGDEVVLTLLDHDANFSPWRVLEERGVTIRTVDFNPADCTLDMNDMARKITSRTKVVAAGYASNAVGTINDVKEVVRLAKSVGALSYIDAVHYTPHGLIDVRALDCDFLVCSTYKFFGPHMGVLFGKREHLKRLHPYKVRPLTNEIPYRWEFGTLNHECIAGITACVDYLADLGRQANPGITNRRGAIVAAYEAITQYEHAMMERLISELTQIKGSKVYGISDPKRFQQRCPTIALRIEGRAPLELATKLGDRGFFTWDGNYYALNVTERLDVEKSGGFLRIGLVHYNTMEEVDRLLAALREIVGA